MTSQNTRASKQNQINTLTFTLAFSLPYTMPLLPWKKNIWRNITELKKDNMKKWKAKWANGTPRPMKQIIAIALSKSKK